MADRVIHGPNGYATDTASPINYFPNSNDRARRFTLFYNEHQVMYFDYHIVDDTRYVFYIEVEPAFRGGLWLDIVGKIQVATPGYLDQPRVVWLKVSPYLADGFPNLFKTIEQLQDRDIINLRNVYIEGALNEVVKEVDT